MLSEALDLLFTLEFLDRRSAFTFFRGPGAGNFGFQQRLRDKELEARYGISGFRLFILRLVFGAVLLVSILVFGYTVWLSVLSRIDFGTASPVFLGLVGFLLSGGLVASLCALTIVFYVFVKKAKIVKGR